MYFIWYDYKVAGPFSEYPEKKEIKKWKKIVNNNYDQLPTSKPLCEEISKDPKSTWILFDCGNDIFNLNKVI